MIKARQARVCLFSLSLPPYVYLWLAMALALDLHQVQYVHDGWLPNLACHRAARRPGPGKLKRARSFSLSS